MAQSAEHRLRESVLIPRPFVTAAVEKEGRRHDYPATMRALQIFRHLPRRRLQCRRVLALARRQLEFLSDLFKVVRRQDWSAFHEDGMNGPEFTSRLERI